VMTFTGRRWQTKAMRIEATSRISRSSNRGRPFGLPLNSKPGSLAENHPSDGDWDQLLLE
jgi:hypothetical protein